MTNGKMYLSDMIQYLASLDSKNIDEKKTGESIKNLTLGNTYLPIANIPSHNGCVSIHAASRPSFEFDVVGLEPGTEVPEHRGRFTHKFEIPIDTDLQVEGRNQYKWFACVYFF